MQRPQNPLHDIVRFGLPEGYSRTVFSWHGKVPEAQSRPKRVIQDKVFIPLIRKTSFTLPTDVGRMEHPPQRRKQRPR